MCTAWLEDTIASCIDKIIDNRGRNPKSYYTCGEYPVIDNFLIQNEKYPNLNNVTRFLNQELFDDFLRTYLQKDDIIITLVGNGIGNVSMSPSDKVAIVQNTVGFRCNGKLLNDFLYYYLLNNNKVLKSLDRGGAQPSINKNDVLNLKIRFPKSLVEQNKIVNILSNYDDLIENNNKRIKILEEMAQKIYKEWFVDFKYPGHETAAFKDTELGKIPSDWEVKTIEDVISDIESGSRPKGGIVQCNSGIPSIGAENIIGLGKYDYSKEKLVTNEFYNKMKKGKIKSLDVLLYKDGAQIGRKSMFGEGFPYFECCINEHVFILRTNTKCSQYYLYFTLDLPEYTEKIKQLNTNAAQPGINQQQVKGIKIRLAPISIINKFDEIVKPIISLIFNLCIRNKELMQTRDLLLPRLMSGEINVEDLEIA